MQEFILGNMCQDLLMHTILMCGKVTDKVEENAPDKKTLRFPKHLYDDIVPDAKLTQRHRVKLLAKQFANGEKTIQQVCDSYNGWRQHASKGNTRPAVLAMDKALNNAFKPYGYKAYFGEKGQIKLCQDQ